MYLRFSMVLEVGANVFQHVRHEDFPVAQHALPLTQHAHAERRHFPLHPATLFVHCHLLPPTNELPKVNVAVVSTPVRRVKRRRVSRNVDPTFRYPVKVLVRELKSIVPRIHRRNKQKGIHFVHSVIVRTRFNFYRSSIHRLPRRFCPRTTTFPSSITPLPSHIRVESLSILQRSAG